VADSEKRRKAAMAAGWAGAAAMGAFLAWLIAGAKVEVEQRWLPLPVGKPIYVCDTAPDWVRQELAGAVRFWTRHGTGYGPTWYDSECPPDCDVGTEGSKRLVPCHDDAITIDLRDQLFDDEHAGETVRGVRGRSRFATILVPERVEPMISYEEEGRLIVAELPDDVLALVLAHEMGHAEGWWHEAVKGSGGTLHRRGELMHPKVWGLGWGARGLP
jgi:hypothetical protein